MKKLLFLSLLAMTLFSCKEDNPQIDLASLKNEVSQNKNYIQYKEALNEIMLSTLNREVSFKHANDNLIKSELSKAKNVEDIKVIYKKAGIVGGDRLVELQYQYKSSLIALVKDMPELKKLSKDQLKEILKFKPSVTKKDIDNSANQILNSNK